MESPASGDLNAGKVVTVTLDMSEVVTVNTSGGTPTLTLNDGGTATYTGGSGTNALTFSYTVAAGQNTPDLMVTAVNLNGATIADGAGNAANLSLAGLPQGSPQIDTTTPTISSLVESPASGDLNAGKTVTLTLNLSEAVTVAGGTPTLTLNDGGTATYTGGSGTNALTFSYTVAAGQNTAALAATAINLNSATITDGAGNAANLSLTGLTQSGPQIDTMTPTVSSLVESPASGDLNAGKTVTLTLNLNEAVTVAGGTPTLTLNDGGTATYTGGSGSNALTFSYTVAAGQNTSGLAATAINLNSATITDGAGNAANLAALRADPERPADRHLHADRYIGCNGVAGQRRPQCRQDGHGDARYERGCDGQPSGGTPTLTLNDGGTATYTGGSGSNALTFSYTVAAGQNTAALAATAHQSQLRDRHRRRRQCRQSVAHRSDPEPARRSTPHRPLRRLLLPIRSLANVWSSAALKLRKAPSLAFTTERLCSGQRRPAPRELGYLQSGPLANGAHAFAATATDAAGNVSTPSSPYDPNIGSGPAITAAPIEVGNQIYIYNSAGSGLALSYTSASVTAGEFGAWTPDRCDTDGKRL